MHRKNRDHPAPGMIDLADNSMVFWSLVRDILSPVDIHLLSLSSNS